MEDNWDNVGSSSVLFFSGANVSQMDVMDVMFGSNGVSRKEGNRAGQCWLQLQPIITSVLFFSGANVSQMEKCDVWLK